MSMNRRGILLGAAAAGIPPMAFAQSKLEPAPKELLDLVESTIKRLASTLSGPDNIAKKETAFYAVSDQYAQFGSALSYALGAAGKNATTTQLASLESAVRERSALVSIGTIRKSPDFRPASFKGYLMGDSGALVECMIKDPTGGIFRPKLRLRKVSGGWKAIDIGFRLYETDGNPPFEAGFLRLKLQSELQKYPGDFGALIAWFNKDNALFRARLSAGAALTR